MKKFYTKWLSMSFAAALVLSTAACSDDNEETVPSFPTSITELTGVEAGSEQTIKFEANMPWKLSSDATWCTFVDGDFKLQDISGVAGSQEVKLDISDVNQDFEKSSTANLKLTMGGVEKTIATVTRAPKGYELKMVNAEKEEADTIYLVDGKDAIYTFSANFTYSYSNNNEEAIGVTREGDAFTFSVKKGFEKNAIEGAKFTVLNESGSFTRDIPVIYEGMDTLRIDITFPQGLTAWNWTVSADGQKFSQPSGLSGSNEVADQFDVNVVARNDDYAFLTMEEYKGAWYPNVEWIHTSNEGEKANITVDANSTSEVRKAYVLVFPRAQYNLIEKNIENWVAAGTDESFVDTYESNVVLQIEQESANQGGGAATANCMTVSDMEKGISIPVTSNISELKSVIDMFGLTMSTDNMGAITAPATTILEISNLNLGLDDEAIKGSLLVTNNVGEPIEGVTPEVYEGNVYIQIPEGRTEPMYVLFPGSTGEYVKALMIYVGEISEGGSNAGANITVKNGQTYSDITVEAVTGDFADYVTSELSLDASQTAQITVAKGTPIIIYPNVEGLADLSVLGCDMSKIAPEFAEDTNGTMYMTAVCPTDETDYFIIVFKDENMINKKALVVILQ